MRKNWTTELDRVLEIISSGNWPVFSSFFLFYDCELKSESFFAVFFFLENTSQPAFIWEEI